MISILAVLVVAGCLCQILFPARQQGADLFTFLTLPNLLFLIALINCYLKRSIGNDDIQWLGSLLMEMLLCKMRTADINKRCFHSFVFESSCISLKNFDSYIIKNSLKLVFLFIMNENSL